MVLVLESINVITDVPGFVFVLALDYDVLVRAVQQRYPSANGHEFIEKIIQLPFRIPRAESATNFDLREVVPAFDRMSHLLPFKDRLLPIIDVAFEGNPRSAKRFINALTLLMRILTARRVEFDSGLLAFGLRTSCICIGG
jgi:predicted KAP-like P-loop ATPase